MPIINSVVFGTSGGGGPVTENQGDVVSTTGFLNYNVVNNLYSKVEIDGDNIYVAHQTSLIKVRKSDLLVLGVLDCLQGQLDGLSQVLDFVIVGNNIYVVGSASITTSRNIKKIDKTTFTFVTASTDNYGGSQINAILSDGTFLYIGGVTTRQIWKHDITTLARVAVGPTYGNDIINMVLYGTDILIRGGSATLTSAHWTRYDTATLTQQQIYNTSSIAVSYYDRPFIIGNILYHSNNGTGVGNPIRHYKLNLSTSSISFHNSLTAGVPLSYSTKLLSTSPSIQFLVVGGYFASLTDFNISSIPISYSVLDDSFAVLSTIRASSPNKSFDGANGTTLPYGIVFDNDYIYVATNQKLRKIKR
jgi:hypothetical protein